VFSEALGETIFLCEDEETRTTLIEAGAEPWSIYILDELQILLAQNRIKPLTQAELRKVHTLKRTIGARIAGRTAAAMSPSMSVFHRSISLERVAALLP